MNIFSKIKSWFSKSEASSVPTTTAYAGYPYTGSSYVGDGSLSLGGLSASGASPQLDHFLLRQNIRAKMHESAEARGIVSRFRDLAVGTGVAIDFQPDPGVLGITPEEAEQWSTRANNAFHRWFNSKLVSVDENQNGYQLQRMAMFFQERENDFFVRFIYDPKRKDLTNPLQIQFIDPNQLGGDGYVNTLGHQYNDGDGIERDALGREVRYNVWVKEGNKLKVVPVDAKDQKSGLRLMLHCFNPEYAGQGRGLPNQSHLIQDLEKLTDLKATELQKAINQAAITLVSSSKTDKPAANPFEVSLSASHAGPMSSVQEAVVPVTEDTSAYYQPLEVRLSPQSVGVFGQPGGNEIKPFQSTAPNASFEGFWNTVLTSMSSSTAMPIEVLQAKFSKAYSASRATLILLWISVSIKRDDLIANFLNPLKEAWLWGEVASGRISAPGWSDPAIRAAWCESDWIGAPMPDIDPQKTATAAKANIEMGATTLERRALDHNGSSFAANVQKLKRELPELPVPNWAQKGPANNA
jgi:lambda family phage portal protein